MKQPKRLAACALCAMLLFAACNAGEDNPWARVRFLPVSGYICGVEGTELLMQTLCVAPRKTELSFDLLRSMFLTCEGGAEIVCSGPAVLGPTGETGGKAVLHTFSFRMHLPAPARYVVTGMTLADRDGNVYEYPVDRLELLSFAQGEFETSEEIWTRGADINSGHYDRYRVTLHNQTQHPAVVKGVTFSDAHFTGVAGMLSGEEEPGGAFSAEDLTDDPVLPPGGIRQYYFTLAPKQADTLERMGRGVYLYLPCLMYELDGREYTILAQLQPLVMEPPLTQEYLLGVLNG